MTTLIAHWQFRSARGVGEIFRTKNKKLLNTLYLLTTGLGLLKTTPEDYFTWLPEVSFF